MLRLISKREVKFCKMLNGGVSGPAAKTSRFLRGGGVGVWVQPEFLVKLVSNIAVGQ